MGIVRSILSTGEDDVDDRVDEIYEDLHIVLCTVFEELPLHDRLGEGEAVDFQDFARHFTLEAATVFVSAVAYSVRVA